MDISLCQKIKTVACLYIYVPMIAQVAHIILNTENFNQQQQFLTSFGYEEQFQLREIETPQIKKELMSQWSEKQNIALYKKEKSLSIELIDYGYTASSSGVYSPVHEESTNFTDPPEMSTEISKSQTTTLSKLRLKTSNIVISRQFLEHLGFDSNEENKNLMQHTSPIDNFELSIELIPYERSNKTYLDSNGFSCIAFITTSLRSELERLSDLGYPTTDIHRMDFSTYIADISFVCGPSGEFVELISIKQ